MKRQGRSFKETLNDALRRGLGSSALDGSREPFVIQARPLGLRAGIDPARLRELDDDIEIDEFLRKTARLIRGGT
jgi:hypothetical protein